MFSQFAKGEKSVMHFSVQLVMHMFCLQLLVYLDTFFGPDTTRVRIAYRAWLFNFVIREDRYIFISCEKIVKTKKTESFKTAGFLNDK